MVLLVNSFSIALAQGSGNGTVSSCSSSADCNALQKCQGGICVSNVTGTSGAGSDQGGIATISDFQSLFGKVVGVLVALAGVVLFVLIVVSGLKFITSGGDPKAVEGARKTLTYAVGGLVAILLSYLVLLLIEKVAGLPANTLTNFRVTLP